MADIINFPNAVPHPELEALELSREIPVHDDMTNRKVSEIAKIMIPVVNRMTSYCLAAQAFIANDTARLGTICEQAGINFSYMLSTAETAAKDHAVHSENDSGNPDAVSGVPYAVAEALMHLAMEENAELSQAMQTDDTDR